MTITMDKLTEREKFWLDPKANGKGTPYVSVRVAAEKTKRNVATIYRAINAAELDCMVDGKQRFVSVKSLITWIGEDTARAYGLLPKKDGSK